MNALLRALLFLPPEASTYAASVDRLHFAVITTTMLGATFVFLLAVYFVFRYGRKPGRELSPRSGTSAPLEFTIIGGLLSLFLVFWVIGAVQYDHMMTPPDGAMPIYVTGKQWMWKFSYADGRSSMDVLTVPVHQKIKLVMTSRDVIHSFYVPAFRMKHDVVPGRYYTAWFEATTPGAYDIRCAEYCGLDHSRMLGSVVVLSPEDFSRWLDAHPPPVPGAPADSPVAQPGLSGEESGDLAQRGGDVAARRGCLNCHSLDGQRQIGPTWAGLFDSSVKLTSGRTIVADEAYLTKSMMDPQADIVDGFTPVMPTYRGILPQPEVAALVEFIKSVHVGTVAPSVVLPREHSP